MNRSYAQLLVEAREAGKILPWKPVSTGPGTQTHGRDLVGHEDSCLMIIRGKSYAVAWSVTAPVTTHNVILAAGVIRSDRPDPENYSRARQAADDALARVNPDDAATYALNLSMADRSILAHQDLL